MPAYEGTRQDWIDRAYAAEAKVEALTSRLGIEIDNRDLALKHRKMLLEERDNRLSECRDQVLEELALLHENKAIYNHRTHGAVHQKTFETASYQREWARVIRNMKGKKNVSGST